MSNGNYTWDEVMTGVDIRREGLYRKEHKRTVEEKAYDENTAAGWWKLGLSVLGVALGLGPAGIFLGKQLGEYGTDLGWFGGDYHDWEDMTMEEGKYYNDEVREFNRSLKKSADDQKQGQILDTILDLGKAYVSAGGLTAESGEMDWTTFGSGGVEGGEWSIWGRGEAAIPGTPGPKIGGVSTGTVPGVPASADYVPSLWSKDVSAFSNLKNIAGKGSTLYSQDKTVSDLGSFIKDYYDEKTGQVNKDGRV